ncbi:MAG: type II toxin-antitoxin system YafQ family toxin [Bacteroidales bacterium]|nr:type II toxin-antitoxin system YafQ family toxin [Bacteroidales bacterium]
MTGKFKKDYKKCRKRNYDLSLLETVFVILQESGTLPVESYKTHKLIGNYTNTWEAHIEPD